MPPKGTASLSPAMKFRISRNPARRAWDAVPEDAQGVVRSPVSKSAEGADEKSERTISIASPGTVRGDLPLARTHLESEIQRKSADEDGSVARHVTKARATKETRQPAQVEPPDPTAAAFTERESASLAKDLKKRSNETNENIMLGGDGPGIDGMSRSVPPIQRQVAAEQAQRRPPNLVWRKGADISSATNPIAAATSDSLTQTASQTAGQASMVQSPRSQEIADDAASRKVEPRAGPWPTTERILRNISRKLLIERERRGY